MEKGKRISRLCLALAVALTVAGLAFVLRPGLVWGDGPMAIDYPYQPFGPVPLYEINPDPQGNLWIANPHTPPAGSVGRYDPSTGQLDYWHWPMFPPPLSSCGPRDPRMDAAGNVWSSCWLGGGTLGHLNLGTNQWTDWYLPAPGFPIGLDFDDADRVGVVDGVAQRIYVFDPGTSNADAYIPPNAAGFYAEYLAWDSTRNSFWIADIGNQSLLRLERGTHTFTWWYPPDPGSLWWGIALGQDGLVWLTDFTLGRVSSFDPGTQTLSEYTVPGTGMNPWLVFPLGPIWFSEQANGHLGVFEPGLVVGAGGIVTTTVLTSTSVISNPTTTALTSTTTGLLRTTTTPPANPVTVTKQMTTGFTLYQPSGTTPYGITYNRGKIWYTDFANGRFGQLFGMSALSIGKSAAITVGLGQVFTYTIVVSETQGLLPVVGAVVTDRIPVSTTFGWASDGGVQVGQVVSWENLTITQGQSLTLSLAVRVNRVPSGTLITNDAYRLVTSTAGISTGLGLSVTSRAVFVSAEAYLPTIMRNNVITP